MDSLVYQTIMWVVAGVLLLAYLKRRRNRRTSL
jgi:hypothetical protein